MFEFIFITFFVLAIIYIILWTLKDDPKVYPIYWAVQPIVSSLGKAITSFFAWLASKMKSKQ